jgi:hypothetical protein
VRVVTAKQRARIDELKRQRAALKTPFERIAFDNAANMVSGSEMALRLVAMLESKS